MVGILTSLRAGHFGVRIPAGVTDFLSSPNRPERLCDPPDHHFNGYHSTSRGKAARA